MTDLKCLSGAVALFALTLGAVELETAGELLVDLDASTLSGYSEGDGVRVWPNAGSQADFVYVDTHSKNTPPTYRLRNGAPALRFLGSASGSMTNNVPMPDSLTGNSAWTVEGWIAPTQERTDFRYFLSMPYYKEGTSSTPEAYKRWAFRMDMKTDLYAVEHNSYQLYWGRRSPENAIYRPEVGKWHHICVVHEASGYERVYVNGRVASVGNTALNLSNADPSFFIISGIYRQSTGAWERQNYADYGRIRIQTGALMTAQVISNYNAEKEHYGVTDVPDTLWTDGATWYNGKALALDDNLIIEGDQPLVIDNGASNAVHFITVNAAKNTGLTIDNGSMLTVAYGNDLVQLGNVAGGTFSLLVPNGTFATPNNSITLGLYNSGVGVIGGREDALGIVNCGSSLRVGHYPGGSGEFTIKTNGIVNIASTIRIADGNDAEGHITVEEGGELTVLGDTYICSGTGTGVLDVYGTFTHGTADTTPTCYIAGSATGVGTLNFHPGSVANIQIFRSTSGSTTSTVNIDGATLRTMRGRTSIVEPPVIFNIKNTVTFDIPAGMNGTIRTTVNDLTENGAATIVKTGGGILFLTPNDGQTPSDISSTFIVREGQVTIGNANALAASSTATFKLEGGTVSADYVGGAAALLARIDKSSVGNFMLHGNNVAENLDFSEYPGLTIIPNGTFTYTGTITPYQNKYIFRPTNGLMVYAGNISDKDGFPASVEIYGATDTDGVTLSGLNDGMSGNISVYKGILGISGSSYAAGNPDLTKLYFAEGTSFKLDALVGSTFFTSRIAEGSKPAAILLTDNSANCSVDLSRFPGCRLGTDKTGSVMIQTGSIFPNADNVFLLGGGAVPYYQTSHPGFQPSVMSDNSAGAARVEVGTVGIVNLSNAANTYSGGTSILDGGTVFVTADGFGAIPAEFDEDNIYINGGILRNGNTVFSLAPTRGVKIGPDGAILHPWGTYSIEIPGGLTGAGPVQITDGGFIILSGANNTFQGPVTVTQANQVLTIGGDENFSWASTDGISTPGKVVLKNSDDDTFNDVVSGTGSLEKQGEGRMTLTKSQSYSGATSVEAGTLVFADGVNLANTSTFRNNGEVFLDSFDILGTGAISGSGRFVVSGTTDLDAARLVGNPDFEILDGASLGIDMPAFSEKTEVRLDDGSSVTLGSGIVNQVNGFDQFLFNGSAVLSEGNLKLTPYATANVGSAFYSRRVRVTDPWEATFSYQAGEHDAWTTDLLGAALVLQNEVAGPNAIGNASSGSTLGCAFTKSIGIIMRVGVESDTRDRYGFSNAGTISDTTSSRSNAIAADGGNVIKITVSYDGAVLSASWDCNGTVRPTSGPMTWTVDLKSILGSEYAWIGFTGTTGASTGCEQTISGFSFRSISDGASIPGIGETGWTHTKYAPTYTTVDDKPAFQLTPYAESTRSATWNSTRVYVNRPFRATFKYRVTQHTASPADGMAIVLQNFSSNAADCYGQTGGKLGIVYNDGSDRTKTAGWGINLYPSQNDQCFKYVLDGLFSGDTVPLTAWDLADGEDTEFTLSYDLRELTLTATRGNSYVSASREVNLASVMGDNTAWIGFTGATGGSYACQIVYDFSFAYEEMDISRYANPFVVDGAVQMNLGMGTVGFSDLILQDGANLSIGSASAPAVELAGTTLSGGATVSSVAAVPIILGDTISFDSSTGVLKLVGDVRANGKVKLELSSFNGTRNLIDLTEATTSLTADDFEVTGEVPPLLHLDIKDGMVRIWRDVSTIMILR
ncbi:MAG: autotransporter-associated beta strand repeat-containing protein [Kiritimatiellae bacterium]|nr:autotransporter-associated beta strand repeat-containing protein [Kiritimatiellia bacterium]